jgi:hypothetical protein
MVGNIVCKADRNKGLLSSEEQKGLPLTDFVVVLGLPGAYRGYIAMLAVEKGFRKHGIGQIIFEVQQL